MGIDEGGERETSDGGHAVATVLGGRTVATVLGWRARLTGWVTAQDEARDGAGAPSSRDEAARVPDDTPSMALDQAGRIALIGALEELKAAAAAVQARLAVSFDAAERRAQADAGVPAALRGRGVAAQLGTARHESPHRAAMLLGAAKALTGEMPHTFAALAEGRLSEFRATLVVQQTACLPVEERAAVDRALCADATTLDGVGTRRLVAMVREHAYQAEPRAFVRRAARAENERTVTLRPAPDTMTYLTALLPVAQGVAAYAALRSAADSAHPAGDGRGRGQLMADTLVERLTGQSRADAVPVTVSLVMSDATLLASGHGAAGLDGYGPVPAQVARTLVANGLDADAVWIRRVYSAPGGRLVAASSRDRFHPEGLGALLRVRDQGICRMPYCDAPVRHLDHVTPAELGGATDADNGQGLCEACNHAKQAPGWRQTTSDAAARHTVVTTTPSGQVCTSVAPEPPPPLRPPAGPIDDGDGPPPQGGTVLPPGGIDMAFVRLAMLAA